jgi:ATP-binding cassette subfamily C (CFTR/MRP) protein 1
LDTIRDADIILVTDKGKIVEVGAPDELLGKKVERTAMGEGGIVEKRKGEEEEEEEKEEEEEEGDRAWFRQMWDNAHVR